ncbi:MAG TPA: amidohydrolase [Actinophytocola sp.]|uniref:amidohydrolase n=1 Tax=Actinophytocola sp. TaxID=1872138 RepID=UPI002DBCF92B|nr:amidohydrolase [Actinophytocola sp.]HEU5472318.1 amidohydrolase [Actinophytocola sp.]
MMLDLRLVNANIVTMDPALPAGREIGVWQGRIVGLDDAVSSLPAKEVVDLRGATVLPGFIDPHVHLAWAGLQQSGVTVAGRTSVDDVLAVVAEAVAAKAPGEWAEIQGYDQRVLGRHLTAAELDSVSAGRHVLLVHVSGHAGVVGSSVLVRLPSNVQHTDGVLGDAGMTAVRGVRDPYPVRELADAIERAGRTCLSEGVTAAAEAGIGVHGGLISYSGAEAAAFQLLHDEGRLPIRMRLMVAAEALHPLATNPSDGIARGLDLGLRTGFGGDRLSLGAIKIFTDGGMGPRTAALTAPYAGTDHSGDYFTDPEIVRDYVRDAHRAGWQLAIHAIGDRAVDLTLDALAEAQARYPRPEARHRIEHSGLVRPDQLPRFAEVGATAVVQPSFLWYFGDDYAKIVGPGRVSWLYRGRSFLHHGVPLVASSDRPVTPGAPLRAIQFMVQRLSATGERIGPAEAVTIDEALRAYTTAAAHACHWENELGSLTPGKHADLVVLADDPRDVDPNRIAGIGVVATLVAGTVAHGALP